MNMKKTRKICEADEIELDVADDQGDSATKKVSLNLNVPEQIADQVVDSLSDIEISLDGADEAMGDEDIEIEDETTVGDEDEDVEIDLSDDQEQPSGEGEQPESDEDEELQLSSKQLDDDTVVEIDENMLRSELRRMKLKEAGVPTPSTDGSGVDDAALSAFGGGTDAGDPFTDIEVETADTQLVQEAKIQKFAKARAKMIRLEAVAAKKRNDKKAYARCQAAYLAEGKKFSDSIKRVKQIKSQSVSSISNTLSESRLSKKLAESNLDNAKLKYANKVLQTQLTNEKKLKIVEQLDKATSPKDAALIYENAVCLLTATADSKQQGVTGSASRTTRSCAPSTKLNEGYEVTRWSRLAGIDK